MSRLSEAWGDADKRRALLLSVAVHLVALLLLATFLSAPKPRKLEPYLVITLGSPASSSQPARASTVETPAPQAAQPQVASGSLGEPQARSAPQPQAQAPQTQQPTAQPPASAPPPAAATQAAPTPSAPPPEAVQAPVPSLPEPSSAPSQAAAPSGTTTASALPPIDEVQLQPKPQAPAITVPKPQTQAELPPATVLAVTPQASVTPSQPIPTPQATAQVPQARSLPTPQTSVSVARTLAAPQASAQVAAARPLAAPQASAQVAAPRALSAPQATASVAAARPLEAPQVTASAGTARDVSVTPSVTVQAAVSVPVPSVQATVAAPAPAAGAPTTTGAPPGNTDVASSRAAASAPGGNAPSSGQTGGAVEASAAGRGRAASPDGSGAGSGVPAPVPAPFRAELERPLAVLVDNVHGYPQSGLRQASSIVEMPVEGGLTRLMLIYRTTDPGLVGPIRSARDYFVKLTESMNAVLVHDGGSPGAMIAISQSRLPTLDALHRSDLFSRADQRQPPYNLYSQGDSLRRAVNRLLPARPQVLTGTLYRPPRDAPTVTSVTDRYSGVYKTGFRYFPELDRYRWVRNGAGANDASGENVLVDAVVMGQITARPLPDDPEGRLYIPLQGGGPATLYLHGQAVQGHWELSDGIRFVTADGTPVDLAPFRTWFVLTPTYQDRVEN